MIKIKRILIPVDFSPSSLLAMKYGSSFAAEYGSQLHLLHVIQEEVLQVGNLNDPLELNKKWEAEGMKDLKAFVPPALRDLDIIESVRGGLAFESILEYATEKEIDLIILGGHGKTGFVDQWLGGTAYEVARKANCPVLTVKPTGPGFIEP